MTKKTLEKIEAVFYRENPSGKEPVRDWLKGLAPGERKIIGDDLRTVQYGWPLGMPLVDSLGDGLWEVRSRLGNRIARVLFMFHEGVIVLLHGFIKKDRRTPAPDLRLARFRASKVRGK